MNWIELYSYGKQREQELFRCAEECKIGAEAGRPVKRRGWLRDVLVALFLPARLKRPAQARRPRR